MERAAIEELNARFAWALDLGEIERLRDVFVPDARYVSGDDVREGIDAIVERFTGRGRRTTRHGWSNLVLDEVDGKIHGLSCWYSFAANDSASVAAPVAGTGVYLVADFADVYVTVPGLGWRIAERTITPVFRDARLAPVTASA